MRTRFLMAMMLAFSGVDRLAAATTATLTYVSEPGDFIGQGQTHTYTHADGSFTANRNGAGGVSISFDHATQAGIWWDLSFAAADDVELTVGDFENAQRYPFQDPGHPGLSFSGSGRGCNTLTGEFQVHSKTSDLFGVPRQFDASLEQHCEGATPALFADITFDVGDLPPGPFGSGNLLVTHKNLIREYTPSGTLIGIRPVLGSMPGGGISTEKLRDLVVGPTGGLHAFVGHNDPVLSTFTPSDGLWRQDTEAAWAIFSSESLGGVAAFGDFVFVSDYVGADGILRFDRADDFSTTPFDFNLDYRDLSLGWDGWLYALRSDGVHVDKYDPMTMFSQGNVTLEQTVQGIAVNPDGEIFGVATSSTIYRFSAAGVVQASVAAGIGSLHDIDIDLYGRIAVGSNGPKVGLTDESLTAVTPIILAATGFDYTFVAWVAPSLADPDVLFADGFETGDYDRWPWTNP